MNVLNNSLPVSFGRPCKQLVMLVILIGMIATHATAQIRYDLDQGTRTNQSEIGIELYRVYSGDWTSRFIVEIISNKGPVKKNRDFEIVFSDLYGAGEESRKSVTLAQGNSIATTQIDFSYSQNFQLQLFENGRIVTDYFGGDWRSLDYDIDLVSAVISYSAVPIGRDQFNPAQNNLGLASANLQAELKKIFDSNRQITLNSRWPGQTPGGIHPVDLPDHKFLSSSSRSFTREVTTTLVDLEQASIGYPEKIDALRMAVEQGLRLFVLCEELSRKERDRVDRALNQRLQLQPFTWLVPKTNSNSEQFDKISGSLPLDEKNHTMQMLNADNQNDLVNCARCTHGMVTLINVNQLDKFNTMENVYRWAVPQYRIPTGAKARPVGIPGIGQRPMSLFLAMVITFVTIAGPLAFGILVWNRQRGLYWIVLPACSFLACGCVIAYVLATDGVGLQGSSRGIFVVNQRTGLTTSMVAHELYATSLPRDGITWNARSNIEFVHRSINEASNQNRDFRADGSFASSGDQVISRSKILVEQSHIEKNTHGITLHFSDNRQKLQVINQLGDDAIFLLIRDREGRYWLAEHCGNNEQSALTKLDSNSGIPFDHVERCFDKDKQQFDMEQFEMNSINIIYREFKSRASELLARDQGPVYIALLIRPPGSCGPIDQVNWRMRRFVVLGLLSEDQS